MTTKLIALRVRSAEHSRSAARTLGALVALPLVLISCGVPASARMPELARIYREAALDEVRNPVVVIHGILGSRLVERASGKVVWGAFTSESVAHGEREGARALALPFEMAASASSYDADTAPVYPDGPLEKLELSLLYQIVSVDVYANIIRTLGAGGYTDVVGDDTPRYADDHYTCFTFFYDWRRDNVENALRLGHFLADRRIDVEKGARAKIAAHRAAGEDAAADRLQAWLDRGVRFDVVAHSMGGLVARYFLRYGQQDLPEGGGVPNLDWAGAADIDRLIVVGTPNFGSLDALRNLNDGYSPSFVLPRFEPAILGTMPSIYQLLPRDRHRVLVDEFGRPVDLDLTDPATWRANEWGLFSRAEETERIIGWLLPDEPDPVVRRATAEAYASWCLQRARQFHRALDVQPTTPSPRSMYLFAGDAEPTLTRARVVKGDDGVLRPSWDSSVGFEPGDRTVPRYSALADERFGRTSTSSWLESPVPWTNVTFLSDDHIGLTRNPHFTNNMLFLLLEQRPN